MFIDKKLYKNALARYKEWNQAEKAARYKRAGTLTPLQTWQQYVELTELCWQMCPQQSPTQRARKIAAIEQYYDRVRRLEEWRNRDVQ